MNDLGPHLGIKPKYTLSYSVFRPMRRPHLGQSREIHSYGYAFREIVQAALASLTENPESW